MRNRDLLRVAASVFASIWFLAGASALSGQSQDEASQRGLGDPFGNWGDKTCWCWVGIEGQDEHLIDLDTGLVFEGPIGASGKKRDCSRRCSEVCRDALGDSAEICSRIGRPLSASEVANLGCFSVVGADDNDNNKWDYDGRPCAGFNGCERVCQCPPGSSYSSPRGSCVTPQCPAPGIPNGDKGGGYSAVGGQLFLDVAGASACEIRPVCTEGCGGDGTPPLSAEAAMSSDFGCDRMGAAIGTVTVTAAGGTAPYSLSGPRSAAAVESPPGSWTLTGISSGSYTYTVTDAAGEAAQATVQVAIDPVTATITSQQDPSCCSCADGSAAINAQGEPPFTYRWTSSANSYLSTQPSVSGLTAGDYSVSVFDSRGCYVTTKIQLRDPDDCPTDEPTGTTTTDEPTVDPATDLIVFRDAGGEGAGLPIWDLGTLDAGAQYPTTVTARNASCRGRKAFAIEVEAAPWLRVTGDERLTGIRRGQEKTTTAVVDLRDVAPGSYRGVLRVRCEDCPADCREDIEAMEVRLVVR